MRVRNVKGCREIISDSQYVISNPLECKGKFRSLFNNNHPIHIEIGIGKGQFIINMALRYPEINFIGIDKHSTFIFKTLRKIQDKNIQNLKLMVLQAENLMEAFDVGEVDKIYLNFPDPWPKHRHKNRRLPSKKFLTFYNTILNENGVIEFKTDNRELFDFSLKQLENSIWELEGFTFNLHEDKILNENNILTEYEEKFSKMGKPICKYIIKK